MTNYIGELSAILTALCWAITSISFENAGKKIGSFNLNLLRLLIAFIFLSTFTLIKRGLIFPTDASLEAWGWLLLSGLIGIVIGDLFLFEALVLIGARISMLIYASVPPLTGIIAYLFLGEAMTTMQILGMFVTLIGIIIVILDGDKKQQKIKINQPILGILFAFGGALGQSIGYIVGKYGMGDYDPFASTQIRLVAGIISFSLLFTIKGQWKLFFPAIKNISALKATITGSFFGPFLGISLSLFAVQRINPGVASTLISITPILIIPYSIIVKKEKIVLKEIIGSFIAIAGLAIMFL